MCTIVSTLYITYKLSIGEVIMNIVDILKYVSENYEDPNLYMEPSGYILKVKTN